MMEVDSHHGEVVRSSTLRTLINRLGIDRVEDGSLRAMTAALACLINPVVGDEKKAALCKQYGAGVRLFQRILPMLRQLRSGLLPDVNDAELQRKVKQARKQAPATNVSTVGSSHAATDASQLASWMGADEAIDAPEKVHVAITATGDINLPVKVHLGVGDQGLFRLFLNAEEPRRAPECCLVDAALSLTRAARRCVRGYALTLLAMTVAQLTVLTSHYMYRSVNKRQSRLWCMACLLSYSRNNRSVLICYCAGTCSHAPHRQLQPYSPMHSTFLLISRTSVTRRRGGMTTCHIETT